jgi:hypothetical protein
MAQERLFAAAREPLGCLVLSHLPRLLKVMRYGELVEGLLVSTSTPGPPVTFASEVWTAMHFSKACLRSEVAGRMDDQVAALSSLGGPISEC